ncbi:MAG: pirin family protein [Spirochaetales bacterium]|nr:pirin family protein [Spirochaetales bacterium]
MKETIREVIQPREADIGGLIVRRSLPASNIRSIGPWVFFDHMGPAQFRPGTGLDVIPHPHINLATVTYLFEGEIVHRDSLGSVQTITPGAINLMTAGRGIVHSERTGPELRAAGHRAHGIQLWMGLPEDLEETDPVFDHYPASAIPAATLGGATLRVMIGSSFGLVSPVRTLSPALFAEASMPAGAKLPLEPAGGELGVYLVSGLISIGATELSRPGMAVLAAARSPATIKAIKDSRVVLIGGESLGKRYMWWNFVSSTVSCIEKAKEAWRNGLMGEVPGESDRAPLPESDSYSTMKQ